MKHFVFKRYGWLAVASIVLAVVALVIIRPERPWELLVPWIGGTFSFVYFVQRQALEELRLFKEVFTEFNHRYDALNEALNRIAVRNPAEKLEPAECDTLNDYFNLCAEEFLFYKRDYIYPEVWASWSNGMRLFFRSPRINGYWRQELASDSYYGLRLE